MDNTSISVTKKTKHYGFI